MALIKSCLASGGYTIESVGTGSTNQAATFDCTSISGYENLTNDNFVFIPTSLSGGYQQGAPEVYSANFTYSYNNGTLTVNSCVVGNGSYAFTMSYTVKCIH